MSRYSRIKEAYEDGAAGHFNPIAYAAGLGVLLVFVCVLAAALTAKASVFSLRCVHQTLAASRFALLCLWLLQLPLLYMVLFLSPPVAMPVTYMGHGESWIFGWGRTLTGLLLVPLGFFSNLHSAFRFAGFAVIAVQFVMDALSAVTLADYDDCVESDQCTLNEDYTMQSLQLYYLRDLLCILLDMSLLLFFGYLFSIFGFGRDSGFTFSQLRGEDTTKARLLADELNKLRQRSKRSNNHSGNE